MKLSELKNIIKEVEIEDLTKQDVIDIGFTSTEDVDKLSFDTNIKNVPLKPGVLLHQIIEIDVFDLPDEYRKEVKLKPYHLIFGESSMAIFDAFGVNETAGLTRQACQEHLNKLEAEGKTEIDDAYIAGLVNFSGGQLYQFFNIQALERSAGYPYRIIPHESLHMARNLISFFENPNINTLEPNWWENPEYAFTNLEDASEEFFGEVLERVTEVAFTRYNKIK